MRREFLGQNVKGKVGQRGGDMLRQAGMITLLVW